MKLSEIARIINGKMFGEDVDIQGVGNLSEMTEEDIVYVEKTAYLNKALESKAKALIINEKITEEISKPCIKVEDTKEAFARTLSIFNPTHKIKPSIHKNAFIGENCSISDKAAIMANAVVMDNVTIEDDVIVYPNSVIENNVFVGRNTIIHSGVVIGERCIIGEGNIIFSGVVIGSDGYGYHDNKNGRHKIPQIGIVETGKRVEIGANTTIDRATVGKTFIDDDTKIDNLVQIAHNCRIGKRCYIVAQVGIAGSCVIGDDVILSGQVGVADHCVVGERVIAMAQSGLHGKIEKGAILFGSPAKPAREMKRIIAALDYLPEIHEKINKLEKTVSEIKE